MKKITITHFIPVIILSLILLSMLFSPYLFPSKKKLEALTFGAFDNTYKEYFTSDFETSDSIALNFDAISNEVHFYSDTGAIPIFHNKELLFNKPIIHFQRAGEWVEFKILESF